MGEKLKKLIIVICLILVLFFCRGLRQFIPRETREPLPRPLPAQPKILAFYEEGWGGIYAGSMARLHEVGDKLAAVSPVWLGLKADGQVDWDKTDTAAASFLIRKQLDFFVLVTAGSGRNIAAILASGNHRRNALRTIAAYVARVRADGVCLDFEYVNPACKAELLLFAREAKKILKGKRLFMTVFPYVDWSEPTKTAYDLPGLGEICDGVIVMTYDQHRPADAPGPIAAREWVKDNLTYFLARIPARKLWLGVAGYGYRWRTGVKRATALPAWYCREIAVQKGIRRTYQPETGNEMIRLTGEGGATIIWWEGCRGMREKLALAAKRRLAGVALWRLGYEEKDFWEEG